VVRSWARHGAELLLDLRGDHRRAAVEEALRSAIRGGRLVSDWPTEMVHDWPMLVGRIGASVDRMTSSDESRTTMTALDHVRSPPLPAEAEAMTATIEIPPGDPGSRPHRHSGPVFGYLLDGEMIFELEGAAPRVIRAGEAFWEPGGDVVHYRAANNLADAWTRFVVVMIGPPGVPMLTYLTDDEIAARRGRRHPAALAGTGS
jgi:quercetin dioxygenase-like cupin family protein